MRKWTGVGALIASGVLAWIAPVPAHAQTADLSIPLDVSLTGGYAVGEQVELVSISITDLEGRSCAVRSVRRGDEPAHTGNDLIVSSGDTSATLLDVEAAAAVTGDSTITLGDMLTVDLRMGPDEQFAAGVDVELDCAAAAAAVGFGGGSQTGASAEDDSALPITGSSASLFAEIGLVLVMVGGLLWLVARLYSLDWLVGRPASSGPATPRRPGPSALRRPGPAGR